MLTVALLGAGRIGAVHAASIIASERARLAWVYDTNTAVAAAIAARCEARVAPDVAAAITDRAVDAVVIAAPTATHVELITAAAQAGKAVLCEKPIDLDIERVDRCRAAIERTGVVVQIGFNRRYDPTHRAVRDAVRRGDIGALELLVITSRDVRPAPLSYLQVSGGIFRDMTIHDFDMARFVLGDDPIKELYAFGSVMVDPDIAAIGDVDTAMVVMKAGSGALVHINNSRRCSYGYDQRVEAFGAAGMVQSENLRSSAVVRHAASATDVKEPLLDFFIERYAQAYVAEFEEFIDVVAGNRPPQATFEDGRCALLLADAAWKALKSGRPVAVSYD